MCECQLCGQEFSAWMNDVPTMETEWCQYCYYCGLPDEYQQEDPSFLMVLEDCVESI